MGNALVADTARRALTAPGFETRPSWCQRWVRQVLQAAFGDRWDGIYQASARATAEAWRAAGYAAPLGQPQLGDLLYRTYRPSGHVGIYIGAYGVAENSTVHHPDARGTRSLAAWGRPDVIVRLPGVAPEATPYRLRLSGVDLGTLPLIDGSVYVGAREWGGWLGLDVDWDEAARQVILDGRRVDVSPTLVDGRALLPLRKLVEWHGDLAIAAAGRVVEVTRRV